MRGLLLVVISAVLLSNVVVAKESSLRTPAADASLLLDSNMERDMDPDQDRDLYSAWNRPTWWFTYRKKFKRHRLKKCSKLLQGVVPKDGTKCPVMGKKVHWYLCFFGEDQTCDATTGPLPGLAGIRGTGLGGVHPSTKCTCQDLTWKCESWNPCGKVYRSKESELDVTLPLFSENVLDGYSDVTKLGPDIAEAAGFLANIVIKSQNGASKRIPLLGTSVGAPPLILASAAAQVLSPTSPSAAGQTDFQTNNQEQGVDEADAVKSDGKYVYAAYGEMIVIWDALTGDLITNVTMPAIENSNVIDQGIGLFAKPIFFFPQKPSIRALLLESNRLVVIVDGYGSSNRVAFNLTSQNTVLNDLLATHVRVYDTTSLASSGELTLVKAVDFNGAFQDARAVGDNIHVVTSSYVNSYYWLSEPLQRWNNNFAPDLSEEDYKSQAGALAKDKLIPSFVDQLMKDVTMFGTPKLVRISLWQSILSGMEDTIFSDGVFQAYTQVTSFAATDADLSLSLSGSFMPSSYGYTYSTPEMLIFSAQGWNYMPEKSATGPTTYFLGMKLTGATATPVAVGSLPGSLINQYSLDIFDGHLRAATTIPTLWRWPLITGTRVDVIVPVQESTTENQVVILKIPDVGVTGAGLLTEVSRISNLGKKGESFTAIRFFDNVAYAVTFLRTDPFYVLDLTVTNPRVLGELEITGFSSYLHSINDNNTLILAIGEEADADGRVLGLKISLFDSADPVKPTLLQSFTVEQSRDTWSSSAVSWDFKAFRYLSLGTEVGILIIPVQVSAPYPSTEGNFDGFITYDVSRQGISQRGDIPHVESNSFYGCYSDAYLPQRSLVFNGNVTTLKGHSVISTDLDTFKTTWELQLDDGASKRDNCFFWVF
jgi:Beta propeller domain